MDPGPLGRVAAWAPGGLSSWVKVGGPCPLPARLPLGKGPPQPPGVGVPETSVRNTVSGFSGTRTPEPTRGREQNSTGSAAHGTLDAAGRGTASTGGVHHAPHTRPAPGATTRLQTRGPHVDPDPDPRAGVTALTRDPALQHWTLPPARLSLPELGEGPPPTPPELAGTPSCPKIRRTLNSCCLATVTGMCPRRSGCRSFLTWFPSSSTQNQPRWLSSSVALGGGTRTV